MNEKEKLLWAAHQLFARGKTCGTTGNISLCLDGKMYISASGTCFGTLEEEDLCVMQLDGPLLSSRKPSKEWPLHAMLHRLRGKDGAVIHTHGFYATAWSCLPCANEEDVLPAYTPYLRMKAGAVRYVPYAAPGSKALFSLMEERLAPETTAYLLANHGAIVSSPTVLDAFGLIEELEESAHIAWSLRGLDVPTLPSDASGK